VGVRLDEGLAIATTVALPFAGPERRVEGVAKVSGRECYTADVKRPDALWAAYAVSPYASAAIVSIDVGVARATPGVRAILTAGDIGHVRFGRQIEDFPVLASGVVRFAGERVAAVAAESKEAAEAAARAIEVVYDERQPLVDARRACDPDAPVLHPEWSGYYYAAYRERASPVHAHPNIHASSVRAHGVDDLEPLFASAHRVFEQTFEVPRQHAGFIEPHATLVWIDDDGRVHVYTTSKIPFRLLSMLARVAGVPEERIVVECTAVGGDFGGKGLTPDEFPCYFLARATGRPVRHVQSYADSLRTATARHRSFVTLRTAVDATGDLIAHTSHVLYDGGAYIAGIPTPLLFPGDSGYAAVPYRIPNARVELTGVYTNTVPAGNMRGPSYVETFFAWEQHIATIATALGEDPLAFRRRHLARDGDRLLTGEAMHGSATAAAVLDAVADELKRLPPHVRTTYGFAFASGHTGGGKTNARLRLSADGRVEAILGVADQGSGIMTVVQRILAVALDMPEAHVTVRRANTSEALEDPGVAHSRVTHVVGRAVLDAAERLRAALAQTGAASFAGRAQLLCAGGPYEVSGSYADPNGENGTDISFVACLIGIDADLATGALSVRDALAVIDAGTIINPVAHQGQIDGGFIFGLGQALSEELVIDESGRITTLSLADYKLPVMRDIPPLRTLLVRAPDGDGPYGAKMIGELINVAVAPAIANAVANATGVRLRQLPITAERLYDALTEEAAKTHA
jgi:carbon-monoxide dehydrogenase large subunit